MDDGRVVVGSVGAAHVLEFDRVQRAWKLQTAVQPPDPNTKQFGNITRIKDDVIVVNGKTDSNETAVFVFRFNTSTTQWDLEDTLVGPSNATGFGDSLAIGRDWIIVGAPESTIGEFTNYHQIQFQTRWC